VAIDGRGASGQSLAARLQQHAPSLAVIHTDDRLTRAAVGLGTLLAQEHQRVHRSRHAKAIIPQAA
jgi:hypothetical protein